MFFMRTRYSVIAKKKLIFFKIDVPPRVFVKKGLHRKTPVLESLFNKVTGLRHATLLKRDSITGIFL